MKNLTIGGGWIICINKLTEERSHIFVKELQWSSEKIFKYENSTYVNIFGPEQKIYWKSKIIILNFVLTYPGTGKIWGSIDRFFSFFPFFFQKIWGSIEHFFSFFPFFSKISGSGLSIVRLVANTYIISTKSIKLRKKVLSFEKNTVCHAEKVAKQTGMQIGMQSKSIKKQALCVDV